MNYEQAIDKAVKLLRLSTSSNPHEAALAASRAQEIIDRFNIEAAALALDGKQTDPDEPVKDFASDPLDKFTTWKWRFLAVLVKLNGCKAYRNNGALVLVGRPSDVQTVRYFYAWLVREIDSLARKECKGNGRVYSNNWRIGCAETVAERLRSQQKATRQAVVHEIETGSLPLEHRNLALVRVNAALAKVDEKLADVDIFCKANLNLRQSSGHRITGHDSAREAGRKAGYNIRMQAARGNLTA